MEETKPSSVLPLSGFVKGASWLNRHLGSISIVLFLVLVIGIGLDLIWHWSGSLSPRVLRGLGKNLGSLAAQTSLLAVGYYVAREILLLFNHRPGHLPEDLTVLFRQVVVCLRQLHPMVGMISLAVALLHFYLLEFVSGRVEFYLLYSGFAAMVILVAAGVSGFRLRRKATAFGRFLHRAIAAGFFLALLLHKIHT